MNHFSFEFDVVLVHQSHDNDPEKISYTKSTSDMIISWYNDFWSQHSQSFEAENIVYSYDSEKCLYSVSFEVEKFDENDNEDDYEKYEEYVLFVAKMLIDPDDDREEPLKIDGNIYLVVGDIIYK
jgi:hypothetical protein